MKASNGKEIKLSFLLTNHNEDCRRLISDLHKQACKWGEGFEIIIVDDCSDNKGATEGNIKMAQTLTDCTYHFNERNRGAAVCRNMLADMAHGEWLIFIDSDGEVTHDTFVMDYWADRHKADIVVGGLFHPRHNPNPSATLRFKYEKKADEKRSARCRSARPYACFTAFNIMMRKGVFERVRFDESCKEYGYEDALFGAELKRLGISICHIDNPLMHTGLDSNDSFLRKTDTSLRTLANLRMRGKMEGESRVGNMADRIERWGLDGMANWAFRLFANPMLNNLRGRNPSLFLFSIYKLLKFININKELRRKEMRRKEMRSGGS